MDKSQLQVGNKYSHANGVCMYAGSKPTRFWDDVPEEDHAVFVFATPTDKLILPHRSLHLIKPVSSDTRLTNMQLAVPEMSDAELIELFTK